MNKIYKKLLLLIAITGSLGIYAQNVNVTIDLEKQRFLGEESNLDRAKYFNVHAPDEDPAFPNFFKDNNVGFGRQFFGPFGDREFTTSKGVFPTTPATSDGIERSVSRFIATAAPSDVWEPGYDAEVASNAAVRYFVDVRDTNGRPEYWEPFNEPFVKAKNYVPQNADTKPVLREMSEWFKAMAQKIHSTPELAKMKVIGFSDAFPSYARSDFDVWKDRTKLFLDIAGQDMDALAVHPYDGINIIGEDSRRSGSNSEAILDMLETYTAQQYGNPKKLAITEFGIIEQNYPAGPSPGFYNESENAITIRGINSMLFNFFERQDNIEICIPFITDRAEFWYKNSNKKPVKPYVPAFIRPTEVFPNGTTAPFRNNTFELTFKQNFYKFWKDIKGDRASITSDNLDVQAQVFVDGNTSYIALNNLDDADKMVNLSFLSGNTGITNVSTKSIIVKGQDQPLYNENAIPSGTSLPTTIELKDGETKIITITNSNPIEFTSSINRKKYYATSPNTSIEKAPAVPITANTERTFNLENVEIGANGLATLRISVGIPLDVAFFDPTPTGLDRLPSEITFNGEILPIPTNWKGYDQENRPDFFGMFELNIDYSKVLVGTNTVTIKYTQSGGHISSVILSLESEGITCTKSTLYADEDNDGLGDPNISIQSCGPVRGFVTNANDPCLNDSDNRCTIPGTIDAKGFTEKSTNPAGIRINNGVLGFILNDDFTQYETTASVQGRYDITFSVATPTAGSKITALIDNIEVGSVDIAVTGGFTNFQDFTISNISINQGSRILKFVYTDDDGNNSNFDYLFDLASITFTIPPSSLVANNDESLNNTRGTTISLNILSNDINDSGNTPAPSEVSVDLDGSTTAIDTTVNALGEGTWFYNTANGIITFTPESGFTDNPTDISYVLTEIALGITNTGNINFEYVQEPKAANDSSSNNNTGAVAINILVNDTSGIDGSVLTPAQVTVDLDPSTPDFDTTLSAGILGNWEYNTTTGVLTFTPPANFSGNPPAITYEINETANDLTDTANVTVTYKEFIFAKFKVTNTGVTCVDKKNGSILIESSDTGDFSVNVSGTAAASANFTDKTTISDLDSGNYKLEITDNSSNEVFVFDISISEPLPINVSAKVLQSEAQVILTLDGSNQFTVNLNGTEFTTTENSLTLQLEDGVNELSVKAEKDCQGEFSQKIVIGNEVMAYPNPVVDYLTVETGSTEEVNIIVFSLSGAQVISQNTTSTNGISYINMQGLAAGIYFVKVNTPNSTSTFKIVK